MTTRTTVTRRSRIHGLRWCRYWPCTTYGGAQYMDEHEAKEHGACICGWFGVVANFNRHVGQRVRYSDDLVERERHRLRHDPPGITASTRYDPGPVCG